MRYHSLYHGLNHAIIALAIAATGALAQFPNIATNLTTIVSPLDPDITISYKIPHGACKTAFETQEQYTGWVNVTSPSNGYATNIFFWFVGAREPTSALTIWLNGGPGSSSMFGFFSEVGPCEVVDGGADAGGQDRFATVAREWGWDRASNMLFIDQPNQVGFSYDTPTNGSLDLLTNEIRIPPEARPDTRPPGLFLNGTFSSMNSNHTANTTETAAVAVWHMLQGFLATFPQFNPPNTSSIGVNLFAESYGGKYGPVFASKWEEMNDKLLTNGTESNMTAPGLDIHLTSLGIVNGCVDDLIQAPYYPVMANSNSYGFQALSPIRAQMANASFYVHGGCRDLIKQCRTAVNVSDPNNTGAVASVNDLCSRAYTTCTDQVMLPYADSGRSVYDIAATLPDSSLPPAQRYLSYLNTAQTQAALGTTLNYTETNPQVVAAFRATGDYERQSLAPQLAALLDRGIRIGFVYGDRDYICNWYGGEAISLAVAALATSPAYNNNANANSFADAGYAPIIVNDSYIGGVVRQFGNLSFSRVYQAGHFVPAYQPETAFQVFARIILGKSLSDGKPVNLATYDTTGPANATSSLELPPSPTHTCWVRNIPETCDEAEQKVLGSFNSAKEKVVIVDGALVTGEAASSSASRTTASSTSPTAPLTGLFTATSTPDSAADRDVSPRLTIVAGVVTMSMLRIFV
ncbi:serine carboxypeptidase [Apiospora rasikravindrae]|uniref:Carboxypeptidase n=1 Tax=Apiospora rasikravindrae TaxID=990691 RepID=A0ABR1TFD1_9PEZI